MRPLLLVLALTACKPDATPDAVDPWSGPVATDLPNPMVPEVPLFPWPSDQYLVPDASSRTGLRIEIGADLMPEPVRGDFLAKDDGFTRIPPIVTWMPGGFDPASLPPREDWGATLDPASPVLIVRQDTFELVPAMVELDAMTGEDAPDPASATLIIRPHRALDPGATYAVVLTDALKAADGSSHTASPATTALLNDEDSEDRAILAWKPHMPLVFAALDHLGVDKARVLQAWTFTVRSEGGVINPEIAVQDAAMAADISQYTLDAPVVADTGQQLIYGTVNVPWFLDADNHLILNDQGAPVEQSRRDVPFLIAVSPTVTTTRPVVMLGHGFFSAIEESTYGTMHTGLEQWGVSAVSTEFFGFSENTALGTTILLSTDLSAIDTVVAQQIQSHADFTMVQRLIAEHVADELTIQWGDGAPFKPLSKDGIGYIGASNGGTQGLVMMTTSPVFTRGALVVPGGGWSHMLQRAVQWEQLGPLMTGGFADGHELQLGMSMLQQVFDPVDSINFVGHLLHDRLPGRPEAVQALLIEGINDSQVTNLVTDWVAGNGDIPLLWPAARDVWGLEHLEVPAEGAVLPGALCNYDLGVPDNAPGNIPPAENGVHGDVLAQESYRTQVGAFLLDGVIVNPCGDDGCNPN